MQICNHPCLSYWPVYEYDKVELVKRCGKFRMLDRLLVKLHASGHRVLLFSTMTKLLDLLEEYLRWREVRPGERMGYLRIDGATSLEDRSAPLAAGPYRVPLLQTGMWWSHLRWSWKMHPWRHSWLGARLWHHACNYTSQALCQSTGCCGADWHGNCAAAVVAAGVSALPLAIYYPTCRSAPAREILASEQTWTI